MLRQNWQSLIAAGPSLARVEIIGQSTVDAFAVAIVRRRCDGVHGGRLGCSLVDPRYA